MRKSAILITGANGEMGHGLIAALHQKNNVNIVALDLNTLDDSISEFANEEIIGNILDRLSPLTPTNLLTYLSFKITWCNQFSCG